MSPTGSQQPGPRWCRGEVARVRKKSVFCGPSGFPRARISPIETGLDGHPDHSALDFLLKIASD
jgi:hypothetical protein